MSQPSLQGVFPPVPTPFDIDGNLATGAMQDNLSRWNRFDLGGYVVAGSSGEAALLDEDEKIRLWQAAREVIPPDRLMIAGVGCESTRATIALSRVAAEAGADLALVLTPSYYHSLMTAPAIAAFYRAVADASPIPILAYNMPRYTSVDVSAATILELSHHPNIAGIKDSSGNLAKLGQVAQRTAGDFSVVVGTGGVFFPALVMGASAGILTLANLAPAACAEIYKRYRAGEWDKAREIQARLVPLNAMVTSRFGPPGLKVALDLLGYYGGPVRPPLMPPADGERAALRAVLAEAGLYSDS
jgi:4-hydroxy-2-oxoglutarate aldolase